MCGIAAAIDLGLRPRGLRPAVEAMNDLIAHRGPDGHGLWERERGGVAFGHRRLAIIDLVSGEQPMTDGDGAWVTYNGEIYNYIEVREVLGERAFRTTSDTEVLLRAYRRWGVDCLAQLRGMFAFALWDEAEQTLFCARDRFGIKPLYYAQVDGMLLLASEAKALLPFLPSVETDPEGLQDYLTFQFVLHGKTLFRGVQELLPGHYLLVRDGQVVVRRYWEVQYEPDFDHTERYFSDRLERAGAGLRAPAPAGRRAGRLLRLRWPRLQHRRGPCRRAGRIRLPGLHGPLRRGRRSSTRAAMPGISRPPRSSTCTRSRSRRTTSARSCPT